MATAPVQNVKTSELREHATLQAKSMSSAALPFALSVVFHASIAGIMLFSFGSKVVDTPVGAYRFGDSSAIELVSIPASKANLQKKNPARKLEGDILVAEKAKPKSEPAPAPTPEPAQNAAPVLGAGFSDGTSTGTGPLGHENGIEVGVRERYLHELRRVIANRKTYPSVSRRLGETGRVVVKFVVDRSGKIENLSLHTPSHHARLNDAAVKLVSQIDQFKPFPSGESAKSLSVEVPIDYVLN